RSSPYPFPFTHFPETIPFLSPCLRSTCRLEDPLMIRKPFTALFFLSLCFAFPLSRLRAQDAPAASADPKQPTKSNVPDPRTKDGKRLLGALDLMKIAAVAAPRVSPDGSRV